MAHRYEHNWAVIVSLKVSRGRRYYRFRRIPILSGSAAYALKEFFRLPGTLATKPRYRPTFYLIIVAATLAGVAMNFMGINPIKALFITAVINGLVAPPLLVLIVLLASDRTVMQDKVSGLVSQTLTWVATGVMSIAGLALLVTLAHPI